MKREKTAQDYRKSAARIWTFICMTGFVMSVVVGTGWGFFPAMALVFMTAFTAGMMACTFSLIERARALDKETT